MTDTKTLKPPRIRVTSNHGIFKFITGNRSINQLHLARLKKSIQEKDLLAWNPIIVNKDMGVVDGQHRLRATIELNLPIYYVLIPNVTFNDITRLNANMQTWTMDDYLHAWIEQGKEEYIKVREFTKKWQLTVPTAIAMLSADGIGKYIGAPYIAFKTGNFEVKDQKISDDLAETWKEIYPHFKENIRFQRDFLRAVYRLYVNEDIDIDRFLDQLDNYNKPLYAQSNLVDWLRLFEDIYNHGFKSLVRLYG